MGHCCASFPTARYNKVEPHKENEDIEILKQRRFKAYRVLLIRARDGFIIFIPKEWKDLNKTYNILLKAGMQKLEIELDEKA